MSLGDDILRALTTYSSGANYRLLQNYLNGYCDDNKKINNNGNSHVPEESIHTAVKRLRKKGFIEKNKNSLFLTITGKRYLKGRNEKWLPPHQGLIKQRSAGDKKIIIAFDVPEVDRFKRDWLRIELAAMDFRMIQKSVWIGPSSLPKKFVINLGRIGILKFVKFFKITESDIA